MLIGEDARRSRTSWVSTRAIERATDMKDAVERLFGSEKGESVLLAPACASFDMFESFEHRGKSLRKKFRVCSFEFRVQNETPHSHQTHVSQHPQMF